MKLGSQLKNYCKDRGWTLTKLSKQSGVPIATLHGWANGRSRPDLQQLKKVAQALEVSLHTLAFGTPDPYEMGGEEVLRELFTGDLRVSIQKIERIKK
jgi:transcriptional regulator with XRE-family HTH domain